MDHTHFPRSTSNVDLISALTVLTHEVFLRPGVEPRQQVVFEFGREGWTWVSEYARLSQKTHRSGMEEHDGLEWVFDQEVLLRANHRFIEAASRLAFELLEAENQCDPIRGSRLSVPFPDWLGDNQSRAPPVLQLCTER